MTLHSILEYVPEISQYFISGFVFLKFYCWLGNKQIPHLVIWSIIISFLITSLVKLLPINIPIISEILLGVAIAFVSGFLLYKLCHSMLMRRMAVKTIRKTLNKDFLDDLFDPEYATKAKVYMKTSSKCYEGIIFLKDENPNSEWLALNNYYVLDVAEESEKEPKVLFNYKEYSKPTCLIINLKDVERILLFYNESTKVFSSLQVKAKQG